VERRLWAKEVDAKTLGIPGAVQIFRIDRKVETMRRGKVVKTTTETSYGMTSRLPEEASPEQILEWVREYWWIEDKQHYRRDHTQREDHCQVRNTVAARTLSILRSGAIFLFELQRSGRGAKKSLPDWQRKNIRNPNALIKLLVG
jgi:predicted transposase YbfD/YdcC